jgi:hypothetical protein
MPGRTSAFGVSICTFALVKQVKMSTDDGLDFSLDFFWVGAWAARRCVSICTFVPAAASVFVLFCASARFQPLTFSGLAPGRRVSVSICTFVPVKQVNWDLPGRSILLITGMISRFAAHTLHKVRRFFFLCLLLMNDLRFAAHTLREAEILLHTPLRHTSTRPCLREREFFLGGLDALRGLALPHYFLHP